MKKSILLMLAALPAMAASIPGGADITVRTLNSIHAEGPDENRVYDATVDRDVRDRDGNVAIPRGANAELVVRRIGGDDLLLDLRAVRVAGRRYILDTEDVVQDGRSDREGVGKNERTAKYLGGGALIGGIIGAIAGGGKGAAIGAASGAAVGAGTQMATRGRSVRVPSESLLTFRLERPVRITDYNQYRQQHPEYRDSQDRNR